MSRITKQIQLAFLAVLVGCNFVIPANRILRQDLLMLTMLIYLVLMLNDKWLKAFGASIIIGFVGYHFNPVANVSPALPLMLIVLFLVVIDTLNNFISCEDLRIATIAILMPCIMIGVLASYYGVSYQRQFYWPLANPIFAGPIFAIGSGFAALYSWPLAIIFGLAALVTKSTTAALCLVAVYAPLIQRYAQKKSLIYTLVMGMGVAGAVTIFVTFIDTYHAFKDRTIMLVDCLEMGRARFFGWGVGSFIRIFPKLEGIVLEGRLWGHAHNELAQVFFESGYLAAIVATAFILWHCLRKTPPGKDGALLYGCMSAFIIFILVGFPFHFAPSAILFGIVYLSYRNISWERL